MRSSLGFAIVLLAPSAFAQTTPERAEPNRVQSTLAPSTEVERPWLYNDDPTIPAPWRVVAAMSETYSGNDRSVSRPFASGDDGPGGKASIGVQLGLPYHFAIDVTGVLGFFGQNHAAGEDPCADSTTGTCSSVGGGLMAGVRFAPFDGAKHGFRLAIGAGYLQDLNQASGMYARVTATYDVGRLRLAAMVHGEHVARNGSDPVDLMATLGASVRVAPAFRVGVEYIVQDLEEAFTSGAGDAGDADSSVPGAAEGGVHQFVGLTGSLSLLRRKLFINFGPALAFRPELASGQVSPVGRAVVSYTF